VRKYCHNVEGANQQTLSNLTNDDNMHYCGYLFSKPRLENILSPKADCEHFSNNEDH
jgi:hypothetical protein